MAGCDIYFNKGCKGQYMHRPVEADCPVCDPKPVDPAEDACVCPPLGEPNALTIVAPVVFDECGINLCKVIKRDVLKKEDLDSIQLRVIDIDFNVCAQDGSKVEFIKKRPNCIRVTLSNICVKFAVKFLDEDCKIIDSFCTSETYLPDECNDEYDPDTNPTSITVDMYAPYGVSYVDSCDECIPTLNYLGFIEDCRCECEHDCTRNDALRQGIGAQALAKVIKLDTKEGVAAVGLTIYLKAIYFIQYRIPHLGLCVPPKCEPLDPVVENACKDFVEGDLLELSVQPLELCQKPKSFEPCSSEPVEDPTPAKEKEKHKIKKSR